jgi:hypothetical protein
VLVADDFGHLFDRPLEQIEGVGQPVELSLLPGILRHTAFGCPNSVCGCFTGFTV